MPIKVDGIFGKGTENAVKAFQRRERLTVDGIVGEKTWAALDRATAGPPPPPGVGGEIEHVYENTPGLKDKLGKPTTAETATPDGVGRFNHFEKWGSIYWTPRTGAKSIGGAIRAKWASLGWERSPLGYPTSHEFAFTHPDRNGKDVSYCQSNFEHGLIIWNSEMGAVAYH